MSRPHRRSRSGVPGDQILDLGGQLGVTPEVEIRHEAVLRGRRSQLLQPRGLLRRKWLEEEVREGGPPPKGEGLSKRRGRLCGVPLP